MQNSDKKTTAQVFKEALDIIIKLIAITTIIAFLLGFGYLAGKAEVFSYEVTDFMQSPTDLLLTSAKVAINIFDVLTSVSLYELFTNANSIFLATIIGLFTALGFLVWRNDNNKQNTENNACDKKNHLQEYRNKIITKTESSCWRSVGFVISFIIGTLLFPLSVSIILIISIFLLVLVLMLPSLGAMVGQFDARTHIKEPTTCVGSPKKNNDSQAICVSVSRNNKEIVRGKLIHRTSDTIFLYVPTQIKNNEKIYMPKSYPIREAIIEMVTDDIAPNEGVKNNTKNKK